MAVGFFGKLLFKGKNVGKGEAIKKVNVGTDLKKKRDFQDSITKRRDEILRDYKITDQKQKIELRKSANQPKINKRMAEIQDRGRVKKMGGGMMGRRMGYKMGTPKPKTNVQKIKETFAPKSGLKKIDPKKQKGLAKLKQERPDVVRKMGYMKRGGRA
jgi:hypothetical protein